MSLSLAQGEEPGGVWLPGFVPPVFFQGVLGEVWDGVWGSLGVFGVILGGIFFGGGLGFLGVPGGILGGVG